MLQPVGPVLVNDLFPEERQALLDMLRSLPASRWQAPTVCPGWSVKDIAQHLLGDDIGTLSRERDNYALPSSKRLDNADWSHLVLYLNGLNEEWVSATRRISPSLLCELLELMGRLLHQHFSSLDLMAMGGSVSWAGPGPAPIWLDVAREYTERWVHQQQIRDALRKPGLREARYLEPLLDTLLRALPYTFQDVRAKAGAALHVQISGDRNFHYSLVRGDSTWTLYKGQPGSPAATVTMHYRTAWRLLTKGIGKEEAAEKTHVRGDKALGLKVLDAVAIIG